MFRNAYQHTLLTVFYSCGSKPLAIWDTHIENGYISKFIDQDIKSTVIEIGGTNVSTTYMVCPKGNGSLGITMPFLVMIVKNLKKYFTFEVTALDESNLKRRFRVSNFQSTTQILPMCTVMPIGLSDGWNQIQFNLAEFMRRAYKTQFVEVVRLRINANIRLRRIYFTERLLPEDELPPEYKLYFPLASVSAKGKKVMKENVDPSTSEAPDAIEELKEVMKGSKASILSKKLSQVIAPKKSVSKRLSVLESDAQVEKPSKISGEQGGEGTEEAVRKTSGEVSGEAANQVGSKAVIEVIGETAAEAVVEGGELTGAETEETSTAVNTEPTEAGTEATSEVATEFSHEATGEVATEVQGEVPGETLGEVPNDALGETPGAAVEDPGEALDEAAQAPGETIPEAPTEATSEVTVEVSTEATDEAPEAQLALV